MKLRVVLFCVGVVLGVGLIAGILVVRGTGSSAEADTVAADSLGVSAADTAATASALAEDGEDGVEAPGSVAVARIEPAPEQLSTQTPEWSADSALHVVTASVEGAGGTVLDRDRLIRMLGVMKPAEAARIVAALDDADAGAVLAALPERKAALLLASLPTERAAAIGRAAIQGERNEH